MPRRKLSGLPISSKISVLVACGPCGSTEEAGLPTVFFVGYDDRGSHGEAARSSKSRPVLQGAGLSLEERRERQLNGSTL
jgi:hypothetical protein